jgi:carbon-monoxide dehydrogenase small subunit/xanthine dehydrogenase YagT iron-sulfur-binding subunit
MDESIIDQQNGLPGGILSRRELLRGAGVSAMGVVLADSGLMGLASATEAGSARVLGPGALPLSLTVNGQVRSLRVEPATTLVEALRLELGLTGTKVGCDRGACSACTVWVDGEVAASCMTFAFDVQGKKVTTIEGLADGDRLHPVQAAFVEHDALQCGFCTPGMVMTCAALVEHNPKPTLEDVKSAVSGNLCRCGTYPNVFKATLAAAQDAPRVSARERAGAP